MKYAMTINEFKAQLIVLGFKRFYYIQYPTTFIRNNPNVVYEHDQCNRAVVFTRYNIVFGNFKISSKQDLTSTFNRILRTLC